MTNERLEIIGRNIARNWERGLTGEKLYAHQDAEQREKLSQQRRERRRHEGSRGENLDFVQMTIPVGDEITNAETGVTVQVISARTVRYKGTEWHLTPLTETLLDRHVGGPCGHWVHGNRNLNDLYHKYMN